MTALPKATSVAQGAGGQAAETVTLDYESRFLRRKRVVTDSGFSFLVSLDQTTHLDAGDAFVLESGALVGVRAAEEPILRVTGDLARLAWHIGNRHTPCAIANDHLVIRQDKVLAEMLIGLGAQVEAALGPFEPEGGAYGHGRTMGHDHGGHDHSHQHDRDHGHDKAHHHHEEAG